MIRWGSLWNPFSKKGRAVKTSALEDKYLAREIHSQAVENKAKHTELYLEQKQLSDELRKEQRRNHFSDMFQTTVPLKHS